MHLEITWIHFEAIITIIFFQASLFFIFVYNHYYSESSETIIKRLTFITVLFCFNLLMQTFKPAWESYVISGVYFPPVKIIIEILIGTYLVKTLWDLWWHGKNVELK